VVLIGAMPDIDRRWFVDLLDERKISQRQFAKKLECDPASVHRLLTGKRPMRLDEATSIAHLLAVPVSDVLEHAGLDVKAGDRTVPLVGYVDGQGEAHLDWNARGAPIPVPSDLPPLGVAVQLRTAATALDTMDGWTLFTTVPSGISPDALGRLCLVGVVGNGVDLLRFVRRGYKRGRFNLVYPGIGDLLDVELDWAVPVLHIRP
jgi:transcriptional regulator with XRE-family HTH domain